MRALVISLCMFATPAFADCSDTILPPEQYDVIPRELLDVKFLDREHLIDVCARRGIVAPVVFGCEWGFGHQIHVRLLVGDSEKEECEVRHADGHIAEWEATGNSNPRHLGWEWGGEK